MSARDTLIAEAEKAEKEAEEQFFKTTTSGGKSESTLPAEPEGTTVDLDVAKSASGDQEQPVETEVKTVVAEEKVPVQPEIVEPEKPVKEKKPKVETVPKEQFESLKGRFKTEMARLQAETAEQQREIVELKDTMVELQKRKATVPTPEPVSPQPSAQLTKDELAPKKYYDEKEEADWGEGMIDLVKRVAKTVVEEQLYGYDKTIRGDIDNRFSDVSSKISNVETTTVKTATEAFYEKLGALVPNLQILNHDKGFLAWLVSEDEYGNNRRAGFDSAAQSLNADKVARYFNKYVQDTDWTEEPVPVEPTIETATSEKLADEMTVESITESEKSTVSQDKRESMITPAKTKSTVTPIIPQKQGTRKMSEYKIVEKLTRQGKYMEAAKLEAELDSAGTKGLLVDDTT